MSQIKKTSFNQSPKRKSSYRNTGTYIILFLALFSIAFIGVCNPQGYQSSLSGVAGSVDGDEISKNDFTRAYRNNSERFRQTYGDRYDASLLKIAHRTLDQLITARILYLESAQLGTLVGVDEVAKYLTKNKFFYDNNGQYSQKLFQQTLERNQLTEASYLEYLQRDLSLQRLQNYINSNAFLSSQATSWEYQIKETKFQIQYLNIDAKKIEVPISQDETDAYLKTERARTRIKQWYDSHQSEYQQAEQVKARHILVSYEKARNAPVSAKDRSKEAAETKANNLHQQLSKQKDDFVRLAKKETDEPSGKTSGGELGFFTFDTMNKEFSSAAFSLKVGEISEVVETPFGFHIIQVTDKKPKKDVSLEKATPEIIRKLIKKEKAPKESSDIASKVIKELQEGRNIDALLKKHQLAWKETAPFSATTQYIPGISTTPELFNAIFALTNKGQHHLKPIQYSIGSYYIIKLKDKIIPDINKIDKAKQDYFGRNMALTEAYFFFNYLIKNLEKSYQESGKIYRNPSYLELDNPARES
jgi:peptidyl-prolyl cis-trans isomerase D